MTIRRNQTNELSSSFVVVGVGDDGGTNERAFELVRSPWCVTTIVKVVVLAVVDANERSSSFIRGGGDSETGWCGLVQTSERALSLAVVGEEG